jgi:dTDP-4-amino-4,6-dideoxygalactose transaminase
MTLDTSHYEALALALQRRDERRAYRVVDLFEQELCDFTERPYAVAVNSCTNALFLSLTWERMQGLSGVIELPRHTYIGVLQSVLNAGYDVAWRDDAANWQDFGYYRLKPSRIWDSARYMQPLPMTPRGSFVCLSFHSAKQLPIGRGGAILTDNEEAAEWFRAARMDGRAPGDTKPPIIGNTLHCPMPPDVAARGLDILSRWTEPPKTLPHETYPDLSQWYP